MNTHNSDSIILGDEMWSEFNRKPFGFRHSLADHPLLTLPALRALAIDFVANRGPGRVSVFDGNKGRSAKWADWDLEGSRSDLVASAFEHLNEEDRTLVVIQDIELDTRYAGLLQRAIAEVAGKIPEGLRDEITWPSAYLFIAAPNFYTPYHMDHEVGMLLQIHGNKDLFVYDGSDRTILSERQLEQYYAGNLDAASLPDDKSDAGRRFELTPGTAAHFPTHAPHWVRNGREYSVSLSINLCLRSLDQAARIWQVNHFLRKVGIHPRPPGYSRTRDLVKRSLIDLISTRHPATKKEMLRSGVERIYDMAALGQKLIHGRKPERQIHGPHPQN